MTDKEILILIVVAGAAFWLYTTGKPAVFLPTSGVPAGEIGTDLTYLSYSYTPSAPAASLPDTQMGYAGIPTGECSLCNMVNSIIG